MNKELSEIMKKYNDGKATLEETNAKLSKYGIQLDTNKNPSGGWTEEEIKEGFIDPKEPAPAVAKLSDYQTRIPELAGKTITVHVKEGTYRISYFEDGYHEKSIKI